MCDRLMEAKLKEQTEVYEYALQNKEREKMAVELFRQQTEENYLREIVKRDESIGNLTTNLTKYKKELGEVNTRLDMYHQDVVDENKKNE